MQVLILILTPFLGTLLIIPIDNTLQGSIRVKSLSLFVSLFVFCQTAIMWVQFDSTLIGYQFSNGYLGIDGISLYFIVLTGLLTPVCILSSWSNVNKGVKHFIIAQLVIEGLLLSVFLVQDLLFFYITFESVLVPLFLVVGIWGGSPTRQRSAILLFLYTLAGSLFILLSILSMYNYVGTTDMNILTITEIDPFTQKLVWFGFFIALAVKTPIVPFHIWLPRAHADAPLAGSIVLAGTVLKLATYGYLRVIIPILPSATAYFTPLVQTIAIISLVYSSLATIRQVDFKALVAYSSVSHIAVVVLGLFSNTIIGIEGAILLSLAHGFISPALFILVGGVLYDRFHTRSIMYYRGIAQVMPIFATLFFFATACNIGVPISLNWASEIIALSGTFQHSPIIGIIGSTGIILSACYSIWIWSRLVGGNYSQYLGNTIDITHREFCVLFPLIIPAIILGIFPNAILVNLHIAVTELLYITPPFAG